MQNADAAKITTRVLRFAAMGVSARPELVQIARGALESAPQLRGDTTKASQVLDKLEARTLMPTDQPLCLEAAREVEAMRQAWTAIDMHRAEPGDAPAAPRG